MFSAVVVLKLGQVVANASVFGNRVKVELVIIVGGCGKWLPTHCEIRNNFALRNVDHTRKRRRGHTTRRAAVRRDGPHTFAGRVTDIASRTVNPVVAARADVAGEQREGIGRLVAGAVIGARSRRSGCDRHIRSYTTGGIRSWIGGRAGFHAVTELGVVTAAVERLVIRDAVGAGVHRAGDAVIWNQLVVDNVLAAKHRITRIGSAGVGIVTDTGSSAPTHTGIAGLSVGTLSGAARRAIGSVAELAYAVDKGVCGAGIVIVAGWCVTLGLVVGDATRLIGGRANIRCAGVVGAPTRAVWVVAHIALAGVGRAAVTFACGFVGGCAWIWETAVLRASALPVVVVAVCSIAGIASIAGETKITRTHDDSASVRAITVAAAGIIGACLANFVNDTHAIFLVIARAAAAGEDDPLRRTGCFIRNVAGIGRAWIGGAAALPVAVVARCRVADLTVGKLPPFFAHT